MLQANPGAAVAFKVCGKVYHGVLKEVQGAVALVEKNTFVIRVPLCDVALHKGAL